MMLERKGLAWGIAKIEETKVLVSRMERYASREKRTIDGRKAAPRKCFHYYLSLTLNGMFSSVTGSDVL